MVSDFRRIAVVVNSLSGEGAERLGLSGRVLFAGFVKNPFKYVARSDIAVFPSYREGFSSAIIEALACGIPCISTDHKTGVREILAPDTDYHRKVESGIEYATYGILTPVFNEQMQSFDDPLCSQELLLASAISTLLKDRDLYDNYRVASVNRSHDFDSETTYCKWLKLTETT